MNLPPPPKKKSQQPGPSMMDRNREDEQVQEQQEALTLPALPQEPVGKYTVSPVRLSTLDAVEALYQRLRLQRRSLKRYHLAEAMLQALAEDPAVQARVIERLK